ncbi:MAG: hypothetical protein ACTIKR_19130 [Advenella sp.]|uniref:hypothetical protein n=1 Tax=Advenella sp. TaxID=1872388 RepID=UPI003F987719
MLDKSTCARRLVENAGTFVVQMPAVAQGQMTYYVGNHDLNDEPGKLKAACTTIFRMTGFDLHFVSGCAAWMADRHGVFQHILQLQLPCGAVRLVLVAPARGW